MPDHSAPAPLPDGAPRVLVTGGSGFVGSYCILALLAQGYQVRTTVRSTERAGIARTLLQSGAADPDQVEFALADLGGDAGWAEAVAGCRYVLHVASPFPPSAPEDISELIGPARDGSLRVLRAARDAGVQRVVLTSSFAAVGYTPKDGPYTEADWTDPDGDVSAYVRSKTLAERAAWDFLAADGGPLELTVINPTGIFGPVLGEDYSSSIALIKPLLAGAMPATPKLAFGVADVRDVADLHVLAMTSARAAGQRYIAVSGTVLTMHQIALLLRRRLGPQARKVPTRQLPNLVVRFMSRFQPELREMLPELGRVKQISNDKARAELGWQPRPAEQTILDTARSLLLPPKQSRTHTAPATPAP